MILQMKKLTVQEFKMDLKSGSLTQVQTPPYPHALLPDISEPDFLDLLKS